MSRSIKFAPGEYYHIYNRGTEKRKIFLRKHDYDRFLTLLYFANSSNPVDLKSQGSTLSGNSLINKGKNLVKICAYCLMPNHFHLIIKEVEENGISRFMQKVTTAYTMYFNKANNRNGALFQGRFKAEHANDDNYLKYLIAYLHLNPIGLTDRSWKLEGIKDAKWAETFLDNYKYSSYLDYSRTQDRPVSRILSKNSLPQYHELPSDYSSSVREWLSWKALQNKDKSPQGSTL